MRQHPERDLQMAVMRYLRTVCPYAVSLHVPNGGYRRKSEASIMSGMGVMAGCPDILVLWPHGKVGFIELKAPNSRGRLSPDQLGFKARLLDLKIPFALCTSIDDVRGTIKAWGVPFREVEYV